jgi:hypothetical protein
MGFISRITGGGEQSSVDSASAPPPVSSLPELLSAIEAASIIVREPNDDGPRVFVMTPALRGSFCFTREEADYRIRLAYPDLPDAEVARGVRHLESLVRQAAMPPRAERERSSWVHGWRGDY